MACSAAEPEYHNRFAQYSGSARASVTMSMSNEKSPAAIRVAGPRVDEADRVLTPHALGFVADLARRFAPRIRELLDRRRATQARFDAGATPDFLADTASIRSGRPSGSPRRDYGTCRSKNDHQRVELRRAGVHGRFRGRELSDVVECRG